MATSKQFNPIEHLVIDHYWTIEELSILTSYTPQLSRLSFMHWYKSDLNIEIVLPNILSYLTSLHMKEYQRKFDEFEILISKIYWKLKVLSFTTQSEDIVYLDASRWEQLILKYLPRLKDFYFHYYKYIPNKDQSSKYLGELKPFTSSFWIERQWVFETKIELKHG
jgi:hypothetical protein